MLTSRAALFDLAANILEHRTSDGEHRHLEITLIKGARAERTPGRFRRRLPGQAGAASLPAEVRY